MTIGHDSDALRVSIDALERWATLGAVRSTRGALRARNSAVGSETMQSLAKAMRSAGPQSSSH